MQPCNKEQGYLLFLRLVGTAYFLTHRACCRGNKSPVNLYHSCQSETSLLDKHITWLNKIREHVWEHTQDEKYLLPSHTALRLQWLRTVWVVHMWAQAGSKQTTDLLPPENYGWKKDEKGYTFHWDTDEHIMAICNKVNKFTQGCKCKKTHARQNSVVANKRDRPVVQDASVSTVKTSSQHKHQLLIHPELQKSPSTFKMKWNSHS